MTWAQADDWHTYCAGRTERTRTDAPKALNGTGSPTDYHHLPHPHTKRRFQITLLSAKHRWEPFGPLAKDVVGLAFVRVQLRHRSVALGIIGPRSPVLARNVPPHSHGSVRHCAPFLVLRSASPQMRVVR